MDRLFYNANIYSHPEADSILISDNRIVQIGKYEQLKNDMSDSDCAEMTDLEGIWIYPGFHDSHLHLVMTGQALNCANLSQASSIAEIQELLRDQKGSVIHGMGWNQENLNEKRMPERADLDEVSQTRPIVIERSCTHILAANTAAMKKAGVYHEDGIFREDECSVFMPMLEENESELIESAVEHCLKKGITCVQPADLKDTNYLRRLPLYKNASEKIRIHHQINLTDRKEIEKLLKIIPDYQTDTHTFGPFKGFADGSLGGRTAWMKEDYHDDPGSRGICTMSREKMDEFVKTCRDLDQQVVFHAIGDQAIQQILEVYEKYQDPGNSLRWGILHVQITDEEILRRFRDQHILAFLQPVFWKADQPILISRVGEKKAETSYAFGRLNRDTAVMLGTDCPIEDCDVFQNMFYAMNSQDPLSLQEAVKCYTENAAYSAFMEDRLGKLEPGYLADLTFLDRELTDPSQENRPEVVNTMVNGKLSHPFE